MRRRDFLRLSALGAAGALVASCAPKATPPPAAAPTTAAPTAPTAVPAPATVARVRIFVGFGTGTAESQIRDQDALAKEFNASRTDMTVEFMITPHAEHLAKFTAMLAAGDPPDLVMPIGIGGVAELYDADAWMDIQPLIDRDKYDMSDFYGATRTLHTYDKGTLGLPLAVFPSFIYYNKDLFAAAGVAEPPHKFGAADWTFDKLVTIAKQMSLDKSGKKASDSGFDPATMTQWGYDESWMTITALALQFGAPNGKGITLDHKKAIYNEEPYVKRAQWVSDSIWKDYISASSEQSSVFYDVAGDPFGSGQLAMWHCHTWMMGEAYAEAPFAWDICAVPTGPKGEVSASVDADTFVMPQAGKQKDNAWEVAKWMCASGNLERLALTWGSVPARLSGQDMFLRSFKEKFPAVDQQVLFDAIGYGDIPNHEAWVPQSAKVGDAVGAAMDLIRTGQNKDARPVFEQLTVTVQGYLDEYWKTR
jgi:multiple sugar transport system substrate-binding protein